MRSETKKLTAKGTSTRARILDAAREMLVESGYTGVVMRDLAKRCDIKLGNLQYYFPTTEALLLAVIEAEAANDRAAMRETLEADTDPTEQMRCIVTDLMTRWRGDGAAIYSTLNLLAQHHRPFRALYAQIYREHYAVIESAIAECAPDLDRQEITMRTRLVSALIDGSTYQTRVGRKADFVNAVVDQACAIADGRPAR